MHGFVIDEELTSFLMGGNSFVVATRNAALEPHATRATGLRVTGPDRIDLFLPRPTSARTLEDLAANGSVAICVCWPADFRSVQLKGRCLGLRDATEQDLLLSEQQLRAFADGVGRLGHTRAQARNLWSFDFRCAEVQIVAAFAQTPGPGAGGRIEGPRIEGKQTERQHGR